MDNDILNKRTKGEWKLYFPPANNLSLLANHFTICLPHGTEIICKVPINNDNLQKETVLVMNKIDNLIKKLQS